MAVALLPYCLTCPKRAGHHTPYVPSSGPPGSGILFLGEGPSYEENRRLIPFVGPSGREFNEQYLPLAGLDRAAVSVSNATHCSRPGFDNPTMEAAACCSNLNLPPDLLLSEASVVIPMGAVACSLFSTISDGTRTWPSVDLELHHGLPFHASFAQWSGTIFPMYHPAIGLREPRWMLTLQQDFLALHEFLDGKLHPPTDLHTSPSYTLLNSASSVHDSLPSPCPELAIDTETDLPTSAPFCLSYSSTPGTGYVILASRPDILTHFRKRLSALRPMVLLHNALFDRPVLHNMNVPLDGFRTCDSMVESYNLGGILPQSLKTLAYRLCSMVMQDYSDLVAPYSLSFQRAWLQSISRHTGLSVAIHPSGKGFCLASTTATGTPYTVTGSRGTYVKSFKTIEYAHEAMLTLRPDVVKWASRCLSGSNPQKSWLSALELHPDYEASSLAFAGERFPLASITQVPLDEVVQYAGRDADATLRVKRMVRTAGVMLPSAVMDGRGARLLGELRQRRMNLEEDQQAFADQELW